MNDFCWCLRVKTVDGREYVERRDEDGSTVADGYQVDISHWGFVEDFSPDIQVRDELICSAEGMVMRS